MSEEMKVSRKGDSTRTAILLLGTATEMGYDASVVRTTSADFVVPKDVYEKAYGKSEEKAEEKAPEPKKKTSRRTRSKPSDPVKVPVAKKSEEESPETPREETKE